MSQKLLAGLAQKYVGRNVRLDALRADFRQKTSRPRAGFGKNRVGFGCLCMVHDKLCSIA
jgi:hypothetical protein